MRFSLFVFVMLSVTGCCHNLQESYVDSMEATYKAVQADVKAGLYKPDATSQQTLKSWKQANDDARKVLESK